MAVRQTDGLGTLVKRYRTALGLTQEELAERAGVSARSISDLERGLERVPHLSTIRRLADALELPPAQRAVFIAAGSRARGGDDIPAVPEARSGRLPALRRMPWPVMAAASLGVAVLASVIAVVIARGPGPRPTQLHVYSTARAPMVIGSWGTTVGKAMSFAPTLGDMAAGPPGYDYAVSYGTPSGSIALRFSPDGQALSVFPVANQTTTVGGAAVDARGNLWVVTGAGIRKFAPDGRLLAQWKSSGFNPGQFDTPVSVGFARNGDVLIGEIGSHRVQVLTPAMKPLRQWNGPGGDAQKFAPVGFAVNAQDDVYIVDTGNWRIEKYTLGGKFLGAWRARALVPQPQSGNFGFDLSIGGDGNIYLMQSTDSLLSIERLSPSGQELAWWTSVGPHREVSKNVDGLEFTEQGYGFMGVIDGRILKVNQNMRVLASWSLHRLQQPLFRSPVALAADNRGHLSVADARTHQIVTLSADSGSVTRWSAPITAPVNSQMVSSIAADPRGNVVLTEANGTLVDTYARDGTRIRRTGQELSVTSPTVLSYTAVGIDSKGNASFLTYPQPTVKTYSPSGRLLHSWCAVCDIPTLNSPVLMAVSPAGNVYIAVPSEIVEFTPAGVPVHSWSGRTISGSGPLLDAAGIAVDNHGNLYVNDLDRNALEIFSPSGRRLASWKGLGDKSRFTDLGAVTVNGQGDIYLINGKSVLELAPLRTTTQAAAKSAAAP